MFIGYARVSKSDGSQVLDLQIDALIQAGVNKKRIYHDYASSRKDSRHGLEACIKALQPGNTLFVWKLDLNEKSSFNFFATFFLPKHAPARN